MAQDNWSSRVVTAAAVAGGTAETFAVVQRRREFDRFHCICQCNDNENERLPFPPAKVDKEQVGNVRFVDFPLRGLSLSCCMDECLRMDYARRLSKSVAKRMKDDLLSNRTVSPRYDSPRGTKTRRFHVQMVEHVPRPEGGNTHRHYHLMKRQYCFFVIQGHCQ
eukprot:scpid81205/ scgid14441/ 